MSTAGVRGAPGGLFIRDRFTWLAYLLLALFTYLQAILGPVMPFLRAELNLSYTLGGLHLSVFAAGMVTAGITGAYVLRAGRRGAVFWGGAGGMAIGAYLLAAGSHVLVTLGASLLMGLAGALMMVTLQAALSDHHGEARAIAFAEANVAGGVSAGLSPLLVGGFQQAGISWRLALYVAVGALAILIFCSAGTHVPVERRAPDFVHEVRGALPPAFWGYWVVILFSVAIEFCMIGWGAEFLNSAVGLERSTASTSMTLFFVAMVLGRLAGSRLARRTEARRLLVVAFGIVAGGFPLFWLSASPLAALTGLAVTGLGIGNLFPLTLAVAVAVAQGHTDVASARVTLGAGLAILTAPLALGRFADEIGIADAYGVTLLLIVGGLAMVLLTNRLETRLTPGARSVGDGRVRRPRP